MGNSESGPIVDLTRRMFSPKEIAEMFSVTEYTVREWIKAGELKATRLGSGSRAPIRVPEAELQDFATKRYGDVSD